MRRKVGGTRKHARKTTHRKTTRRRRRISGISGMSGMLQKAGGLILGAVAARELNTLAVKFFPSLSPLMSGVLQMGAGFMLPKFIKGSFFANMADGMIANGGMVTIVSTGIISGVGNTMTYRINGGTSRIPVIAGTGKIPVVSGPTTRISNTPTNSQRVARNFPVHSR